MERTGSRRVVVGLMACTLLAALAVAPAAQAQPFGAWMNLAGNPQHGYVRIPHSTALNPTGALTVEAWVNLRDANGSGGCSSLVGKGWTQAWWLGICGTTFRTYLKGSSSQRNGGVIPNGQWTHVAVVFNGSERRHYINGELVATFAETAPLTTSTAEVRIGSDVSWQFTPQGSIDEVRLWNVARTTAQIRDAINVRINTAQPGLVSVWALDGNSTDVVGPHEGSAQGNGVTAVTFPVALTCGSSTVSALCLNDRFSVTGKFRAGAPGTAEGTAQVVVAGPGSGIFWFFSSSNWEVMVKALNGCGLNNRHWYFSAATTNVFYRMEVLDVRAGVQKIYFNYPGPPAPAVTDTTAFATCP